MDLAAKLQLKAGQSLETVEIPESVAHQVAEFMTGGAATSEGALLVFVADRSALAQYRSRIAASGGQDRLTWVAYPKSGQLDTDLNRDALAALLTESDLRPVRQIAIDDVWSALRFRPK